MRPPFPTRPVPAVLFLLGLGLSLSAACGGGSSSLRASRPVGYREFTPVEASAPAGPEQLEEDAAELARLRRATAQETGTSGQPADTTGWTVHEPEKSWSSYTLRWEEASTAVSIEYAVIRGAKSAGLVTYKGVPHRNWLLRDVLVEPAQGFKTWWGIRVYEISDWVLERVEVRNMGGNPGKPEGHAFYGNVAGDLTFDSCWFHDNKGQAVQVVARPEMGTAPATGKLTIRDCLFAENGFESDRAGFAISVFGPGAEYDVLIEDTRLEALHLPPYRASDGVDYYSRGGLCIAPVGGKPAVPVWWDSDEPPFTNGEVVIDGLDVEMRKPFQPLALFRGIRELQVTNSRFFGGPLSMVVIDAPGAAGRETGHVIWKDNEGDGVLWYRGQQLGPIGGTYELGEPQPRPGGEPAAEPTGELPAGEGQVPDEDSPPGSDSSSG